MKVGKGKQLFLVKKGKDHWRKFGRLPQEEAEEEPMR